MFFLFPNRITGNLPYRQALLLTLVKSSNWLQTYTTIAQEIL